jgi:hypothetical protein
MATGKEDTKITGIGIVAIGFMGMIHQPMNGKEQRLVLFNEARNDPISWACDRSYAVLADVRGMGRERTDRSREDRAVSLSSSGIVGAFLTAPLL